MVITLLLTANEAGDLATVLNDSTEVREPVTLWRALDTMGPLLRSALGKQAPAVIECTMDEQYMLKLIEARLIDIWGTVDKTPAESNSAWLRQRILDAQAVEEEPELCSACYHKYHFDNGCQACYDSRAETGFDYCTASDG